MKAEIERRVRLFRNNRNQAVRIPRDMEFSGDEVILRKEGDRLVIEPVKNDPRGLLEFLDSLEPLDIDFPEIADPPADPVTVFDDWDEEDFARDKIDR